MDGSGVAGVGFVEAGGDGPELLQLGEGFLDQVAPAVHVAAEADDGLAVRLGWDHRGGTTGVKLRPEAVGVESLVAEKGAEGDALDQRRHAGRAVGLGGAHRGGTTGRKLRPEAVGVESLVAEKGAEGDALDQRRHADAVVALTGPRDEARRAAGGAGGGGGPGGGA